MSPERRAADHGRTCSECGGDLVDGSMGIPLLGSPRFAVKLGATEVTTEVLAGMCRDCGRVELRARDPERIRVAAAAAANARRTRRMPWSRRPDTEA
jgi:hypothetical protein